MKRLVFLSVSLIATITVNSVRADGTIQAVNQNVASLAILQDVAETAGLEVVVSSACGSPLSGDVLVWEARKDASSSLTKQRADEIEAYVRGGGNLLVSCGLLTWGELYRLTAVCPTTGWHGLCAREVEPEKRVNQGAAVLPLEYGDLLGLGFGGCED